MVLHPAITYTLQDNNYLPEEAKKNGKGQKKGENEKEEKRTVSESDFARELITGLV
jgi:hypothetical protein